MHRPQSAEAVLGRQPEIDVLSTTLTSRVRPCRRTRAGRRRRPVSSEAPEAIWRRRRTSQAVATCTWSATLCSILLTLETLAATAQGLYAPAALIELHYADTKLAMHCVAQMAGARGLRRSGKPRMPSCGQRSRCVHFHMSYRAAHWSSGGHCSVSGRLETARGSRASA